MSAIYIKSVIFYCFRKRCNISDGWKMEISRRKEASFWTQLKATMIRNLLRKKRALRHTLQVSQGTDLVLCNEKVPFKYHSSNVNSMERLQGWHGKAFRRVLRGSRSGMMDEGGEGCCGYPRECLELLTMLVWRFMKLSPSKFHC